VFAPQAADLCRIVPELGPVFDVDESKGPEGGDIADAIVRTLQRWAATRPLLICIEDMHWSDPESIVVLNQLLATNDPAAPSVIATWRDTDVAAEAVHARAARTRLLADAGRAAGTCRVTLEGLAEDDIVDVFRSIRHAEPDRELIRQLAEHTGGNPLFVTELIRGGLDDGMAPTDTIKDVVLRRLDLLPANAADILAAAALCHPAIDEPMLAELTGFTEDQLGDCCEAALAARLIEESPQHIGNYRFSHDLLAETLAGTLRKRRRSELHARIGGLLEKRSAPAADIAHHHLLGIAAGSSLEAARFAHLAGIEASELADYEAALRFFDGALDALDHGPDAPARRIDITIDRAQVLKSLSRHVESQQASMRAFELASEAGDVDLMIVAGLVYVGRARIDRTQQSAEWLGYWSPADESVDILERALEPMGDDHRWRPVVVLALSNQLFAPHHDQARAEDLARTGLELVRRQGDPATLSESLVAIAHSHTRSLPREERKAMLREGVELARATGQPHVELRGRKALVGVALDERNLAEAKRQVGRALVTGTDVDDPFAMMLADSMRISLDLLGGDFPQARSRILESFTTYAKFGDAAMDMFGMQYFALARAAGEFGPIIDAISDKLTGYDGPAYGAPLAATLARSGDLARARAVIDRFTIIDMTWGGEGVLQFMTPAFFSDAVADLAPTQPDVIGMIPPLLAALEPASDRLVSLVGGADYPSAVPYYIGRLHTAAGDVDNAAEMLGRATEHLRAIEARPALLLTTLAVAENHAAAGDGSAAEATIDYARPRGAELGMEWVVTWAEARIQHRLGTGA
jgi:tetratricopeptide (TPR) repeat protein